MKLRVLGTRFSTVVTAHGSNILMKGKNGDVLEVDEVVGAALMRDLPGIIIPYEEESEAVTVASTPVEVEVETVQTVVEMVQVPAEIVAPPAVGRTRQIVKKPPASRPAAKAKAKPAAKPVVKPRGKPKGK